MPDCTTATVPVRPNCDICGKPAQYDAKTIHGPWAYLCQHHYETQSFYDTLGEGKGQRLVVPNE